MTNQAQAVEISAGEREHDDECATICPVPVNEKCRIGHSCWCADAEDRPDAAPLMLAALEAIAATAEEDPVVIGASDEVIEAYTRHFDAAEIARAAIRAARGEG